MKVVEVMKSMVRIKILKYIDSDGNHKSMH